MAGGRLDEPGLDPELPEPKPLIGLEVHLWPGEQRVVVAPRVLEQIPGQLLLQGALIALEPPRSSAESQTVYWFGT